MTSAVPFPRRPGLGRNPMPFPPVGWSAGDALAVLRNAFLHGQPGVPGGPYTPVRVGSSAVFRAGDCAVKVHPPGTDASRLRRIAAATAPVPGVLAADLVAAVPGGTIAVYRWLGGVRPVTWPELGALLRDLHAADPGPVDRWAPCGRVAEAATLAGPRREAALLACRDRVLDALGGMSPPLGTGLIHGDVSLANTRTGAGGRPHLTGTDFAGRGPLAYDLCLVARRYRAGEVSRRDYAGFCEAYGFNIARWKGGAVIDELVALSASSYRIWRTAAAAR